MGGLLVPDAPMQMDACLPRGFLARLHAESGSSEPPEVGMRAA
jgi:hypothetical protein